MTRFCWAAAGAAVHEDPLSFGREARTQTAFSPDPHYDAKTCAMGSPEGPRPRAVLERGGAGPTVAFAFRRGNFQSKSATRAPTAKWLSETQCTLLLAIALDDFVAGLEIKKVPKYSVYQPILIALPVSAGSPDPREYLARLLVSWRRELLFRNGGLL